MFKMSDHKRIIEHGETMSYQLSFEIYDPFGNGTNTKTILLESLDDTLFYYCKKCVGDDCTISFDKYYRNSYLMNMNKCFPYIMRNGLYEWNVSYEAVSIRDFLLTNQLTENDNICFSVNNYGGNGDTFSFIVEWILATGPQIIDTIKTISDVITVVDCFKKLYDWLLKRKKPEALDVREMIQKQDEWNINDLSSLTNLYDEDILNAILLSAGFEREDNKYIKNKELSEKLDEQLFAYDEDFFGPENGKGLYIDICFYTHKINQLMAELQLLSNYHNSDCFNAMQNELDLLIQRWDDYLESNQGFRFVMLKKQHKTIKRDVRKMSYELEYMANSLENMVQFLIDKYEQ